MTKRNADRTNSNVSLPRRMTDMLSRVRFNLHRALLADSRAALMSAAATCAHCETKRQCDDWIASHSEGDDNSAPDFCPNAAYVQAHRSTRR